MSTLQIINVVASTISSLFALLITVSKPFRSWIMGAKKDKAEQKKREENQVETDKCLLRDRILNLYYIHKDSQRLRYYEYENISQIYTQYKKLGGNSFVDSIYNEMKHWEIQD